MIPGGKKTWSSRTRDFWCCCGTMVQAQTMYPSLIYYVNDADKAVCIEQYINSAAQLDTGFGRVSISQEVNMDYCQGALFGESAGRNTKSRWTFSFTVTSEKEITLRFRIPAWAVDAYLDGKQAASSAENGYFEITGSFDNRTIQILFVSKLDQRGLSDNDSITALLDGPVVLAATGEAGMSFSLNGKTPEEVLTPFVEHTYDTYPWKQSSYRSKTDNGIVSFIPLYEVTDESYTIYIKK